MADDSATKDSTLRQLLYHDFPADEGSEQEGPSRPPGLPPFSQDQIQALEEQIPEKCPSPDWDDRQIWIYVGMRRVVDILRRSNVKHNRRKQQ